MNVRLDAEPRTNFGKGAALTAGFREARGDVVITIDADLQDDPAEIPRLLEALDQLPTPYQFDVTHWESLRHQGLKDHIERVGSPFP